MNLNWILNDRRLTQYTRRGRDDSNLANITAQNHAFILQQTQRENLPVELYRKIDMEKRKSLEFYKTKDLMNKYSPRTVKYNEYELSMRAIAKDIMELRREIHTLRAKSQSP